MKRSLYEQILKWKKNKNRKPLLLQGARQVGKTFLIKEFGNKEYNQLAYFNFEETPELIELFQGTLDVNRIIETLSAYSSLKITPASTLIFFDEIQQCPRALTSLKYFYENAPDFHVIAAGSLLGVSVGKGSSFPVGKVNFMTLYPMSFIEYLNALSEDGILSLLRNKTDAEQFPEIIHNKLLDLFKKFLFIGGMPEAVQYFINEKDFLGVRQIQNEILNAYERDFSKYSTTSESIKISEIWSSIPVQLAKENKKFTYSDIKKGSRASQYTSSIEWLKNAGLIHLVANIKQPKLPLSGYCDRSKQKLLLLDTGLLGAMLNISSKEIVSPVDIFKEYNGAFIENAIGIELKHYFNMELFYWTSKSEAEVDFLIKSESFIFPLEVKSGLNRNIKSLRSYSEKYSPKTLLRISPRNFTKDNDFINVPLYAAESLIRIIKNSESSIV